MPAVDGLFPIVHDIRYSELTFPQRNIFYHFLRSGCARAQRVQTDTKAVAQQLVDHIRLDPRRIDVVPIAVAIPDLDRLLPVPDMEDPYVLLVGHDDPHKDHSVAGAVAAGLADRGIKVVHAGAPGVPRAYMAGAASAGTSLQSSTDPTRPPVSTLGIVSDERRDALFHYAVAVLAPSRMEGFGLVPLEGLAAGAWVVASDIPAHREVLGDAVSFFPPGDAKAALERVMEAVQAGPMERDDRCKLGRSRAADFSPARSADAFEDSLRAGNIIE